MNKLRLKEKIWLENNKKCPILNKEIPLEKMALDHAHKTKSEEYSENKGVIRTSLDFRANAVLGMEIFDNTGGAVRCNANGFSKTGGLFEAAEAAVL